MKLNNIIYGAAGLTMLVGLSSCDKYFEEYTDSPNSPTTTTPQSLTSAIQVSTFSTYSGQLARFGAVMTQQITGTDFQLSDLNRYVVLEGDNGNEWDNLYSGAMLDCKKMNDDFGDDNPYYNGIAKVMKAINLGVATDFWGDVPNAEAFDGENGNFNPVYDAQQTVLASIQSILNDALADFDKSADANTNLPGTDDFIYGGNIDSWKKAAYVLKARFANRLSSRNAAGSAQEVLDIFADAEAAGASMTSSADNMNAIFGANGNEQNQWYAFEQERGDYMQSSENFIELLKSIDDPRLSVYALQVDTNTVEGDPADLVYIGTPITSNNTITSDVGPYLSAPTQPIAIVSYVEAMFIKAEAYLRAGNAGDAATAHNEAIKAHIMLATGEEAPEAYVTAQASEDAGSINLDKIMTHKYVAGFGQFESYTDWRRTNIPELTPNPNGVLTTIPVRMPTPVDERVNNSNATVVSNATSSVWWDND